MIRPNFGEQSSPVEHPYNLEGGTAHGLETEWLKRIPQFTIKPGEKPVTANGAVMGVIRLPLAWVIR